MTASNSLEGLKKAHELHLERMRESTAPTHPASTDGFMDSAMRWAIEELEEKPFDFSFKPVIEDEESENKFPKPAQIFDLTGTFGKAEVEWSAMHLIEYFKLRGAWTTFTIAELTRFYEMKGWNSNTMFFGLLGGWYDTGGMGGLAAPRRIYLVCLPDGKWCVTDKFIERCARNIKQAA